jgi:hypothetical protein
MEIRPIIGWRWGEYDFIINPIVDLSFGRNGEATFAPNARFARNFGEDFAIAIEYYTDLGPIGNLLPFQEQGHNVYGVVDFKVGRFDIELGVGYGLTQGSDRWMTKMMITTNLFDDPGERCQAAAEFEQKAAIREGSCEEGAGEKSRGAGLQLFRLLHGWLLGRGGDESPRDE